MIKKLREIETQEHLDWEQSDKISRDTERIDTDVFVRDRDRERSGREVINREGSAKEVAER